MSSIFDDFNVAIRRLFGSGQQVKPTETYQPSAYAVPVEFAGLEQLYFGTDPFYRFFRDAFDIVGRQSLPDGSRINESVKYAGLTGVDFGNFFYKLKEWYDRSNLYTAAKSSLDALNGTFKQLEGVTLPDGSGLLNPVNISLSVSGADASGLMTKLVDWYNHVGLYNQLESAYRQMQASLQTSLDAANQQLVKLSGIVLPDQTALFGTDNIRLPEGDASGFIARITTWRNGLLQYDGLKPLYDSLSIGWNTVMDYRLPDGSRFVDNIRFGSIDFTPLIAKLNDWYTGNNAFNAVGNVKFSGALAQFRLMDLFKNPLGQISLDGFASNLTDTVNTAIDTYVIRPVEDFATQLAVAIMKLVFRIQALEIRILYQLIYGIDEIMGPFYWTMDDTNYERFLSDMLIQFNSVADLLLPGVGFRFVTIAFPTSKTLMHGDPNYFDRAYDDSDHALGVEKYIFTYFRSVWELRPKLKLVVPECYGKAGDWNNFVQEAFGVPVDRLLHDILGVSKGGLQWAGIEYTKNQNTVRNMPLLGVPEWLKGRDNFFNQWFGKLPLNPFDLGKAWTARPPTGSDPTPPTPVTTQQGTSSGTYPAAPTTTTTTTTAETPTPITKSQTGTTYYM